MSMSSIYTGLLREYLDEVECYTDMYNLYVGYRQWSIKNDYPIAEPTMFVRTLFDLTD